MSFYQQLHQQLIQSKKRISHRKHKASSQVDNRAANGGVPVLPYMPAPSLPIKTAWRRAHAFNVMSYRVPGIVVPVRQPSSMTCWATVTTMMLSWREQASLTIERALDRIGQVYVDKFHNNQGLAADEKGPFLAAVGLQAEPAQSYSLEGWLQLLKTYGPLWVTTDESQTDGRFAIHARILVGMSGDGTPNGTQLVIVDPAIGAEIIEDFSTFITKFEREIYEIIKRNPKDTSPLRIQVVHWPPNASVAAQSRRMMRSNASSYYHHNGSHRVGYGPSMPSRSFDVTPLAWGARVAAEFCNRVRQMGSTLGCEPEHLMAAMAFETGETFSPAIRNGAGSGAVGLIQFMPRTAESLGTSTEALAKMSALEQLEFVERYLTPYRGRLSTLEDVYMAILMPSAVGLPPEHVLFHRDSQDANERRRAWHRRAYEQNRGLDRNGDGKITKIEASSVVAAKLEKGRRAENVG
jgi:hypothetical protein